MDRINGTIETQVSDGVSITSQIVDNVVPVQTVVNDIPQIQTVLQGEQINISSQVNAPFIEVTSVNGMTGDVSLDAKIEGFVKNHYYVKDSVIVENGNLYLAKESFISGDVFDLNDWSSIDVEQKQSDWSVDDESSVSYIRNKPVLFSGDYKDLNGVPNFSSVALSGKYSDLIGLPDINDGNLQILINSVEVGEFNANSSSDVSIDISIPKKISELENDSSFVECSETVSSTKVIKQLSKDGVDFSPSTDSSAVMVTNTQTLSDKLSGHIESSNLDWGTMKGSSSIPTASGTLAFGWDWSTYIKRVGNTVFVGFRESNGSHAWSGWETVGEKIPNGYRPAFNTYISCPNTSNDGVLMLNLRTDGSIRVYGIGTTANRYFGINGSYPTLDDFPS